MGGASGKPKFNPWKHPYEYEMIVIGGGSGGMACAREAAMYNARVALCDYVVPTPSGTTWGIGGTCVNVGCIPKKLMHQAALIKDYVEDASLFGWKLADTGKLDWGALVKGVQEIVQSLNFKYKIALDAQRIAVYKGLAALKSDHEVEITFPDGKSKTITGQCIVIAVGCRPNYLPVAGGTAKDNLCITSDDLFSLPYPPGKTVCIGAGYISMECAGFLASYGFDVTVMARSAVLREFDRQMAELIKDNLYGREVKFLDNTAIKGIKRIKEGSPPTLKIIYYFNNLPETILELECNTILLAIGRKPLTKTLNVNAVPTIKIDGEGYILTDKFERTGAPNIYAIGDVAKDRPKLTPPAIFAGRYLGRRIYDKTFKGKVDYHSVPTAVFTPMEYGCCGYSEEAANAKFGQKNIQAYSVQKVPLEFVMNKRDSEAMLAKIVCLKDGSKEKVIGFHCLGPYAAEITVGFAFAIKKKVTKNDFLDLIGIHPTNAEIFNEVKKPEAINPAGGC